MPTKKKKTNKRTSRSAPAQPPIPFDLPDATPAQKSRATQLLKALKDAYPDAHCALNYTTPHELLIATILSAQCTDVAVNKATPALFDAFPTPADYADASPTDIEPFVRSLGFFRNKAKAVHLSMKTIVNQHAGRVPQTMDELLALQGVARKTANVVLGNAFDINVGVVVDTHVSRLAKRFDLCPQNATVTMIERHLLARFPRDDWTLLSHLLIAHGRATCTARTKACTHPICSKFGSHCPNQRA